MFTWVKASIASKAPHLNLESPNFKVLFIAMAFLLFSVAALLSGEDLCTAVATVASY